MTALLRAATGSTLVPGLKPGLNSRDEERKIHQGWESIQTGPGPGQQTGEYFTTEHPVMWKASPGMRAGGRSGGMKRSNDGLGMMSPISRWTQILRTTW